MNSNKGTSLDGLTIDYSKYDLIITNPPYNNTNNTGSNFYKKFI